MKRCKICGKETDRIVKGMCINHYNQSIYVKRERTKYGKRKHRPNDYIIYDTYVEIILCDRNGNERKRTKVDLDDVQICSERRWSCHSKGYVQTFSYGKFELLHQYLMNAPKGKYIDHINHDTLDNRRCNLRIVTPHQSNLNQNIRSDNSSGHKGVSWHKRDSMWESYIHSKGKKIFLGKFRELQDAIDARKEAESKYFDSKYIKESQHE